MNSTASSLYDKKSCKAYIDAVFPIRKWIVTINGVISILVLAVCIYLGVTDNEKAFSIILPLIFLLLNNIFIGALLSSLPALQYKSSKELHGSKCEFIFRDNEFETITHLKDGKEIHSEPVKYSCINKVKKRKDYIIIFERQFVAHTIEISSLKGATADELVETIKKAVH